MVRRIHLAFLTLIPRVKLFPRRCAVMVSSRQARSVTPARVTIRRAAIHRLANLGPEPCVTQLARLAAQVIASLRRARSYAGSQGTIGVIRPSSVPVTRRRAQRISPSQMVRTSSSSNPDRSHTSSRSKLWDWGACLR